MTTQSDWDSIGVKSHQKDTLEETRELIEEQDGHMPTQGETVQMACEALQEVRGL